jgi:hypothetical protein
MCCRYLIRLWKKNLGKYSRWENITFPFVSFNDNIVSESFFGDDDGKFFYENLNTYCAGTVSDGGQVFHIQDIVGGWRLVLVELEDGLRDIVLPATLWGTGDSVCALNPSDRRLDVCEFPHEWINLAAIVTKHRCYFNKDNIYVREIDNWCPLSLPLKDSSELSEIIISACKAKDEAVKSLIETIIIENDELFNGICDNFPNELQIILTTIKSTIEQHPLAIWRSQIDFGDEIWEISPDGRLRKSDGPKFALGRKRAGLALPSGQLLPWPASSEWWVLRKEADERTEVDSKG